MSFFSNFLNNSGVIESDKLAEEYNRILMNSEEIEVGFKLKEDTFIFTNKRLILVEVKKEKSMGLNISLYHIFKFPVLVWIPKSLLIRKQY